MARKVITAVLGALLLIASACGGPSAAEKEAAAKKKQEIAAKAAALKIRKANYNGCAAAINPFIATLDQINSRLSVGLNNQEYGDRLGDARVAYDKIPIDQLKSFGMRCLQAAAAAETSYNRFVEVKNLWDNCIDDYSCDFSKGQTNATAQDKWSRAGTQLSLAKQRLASMAPPAG